MRKIENLQELRQTLSIIEELRRISRSLHTLDENACNYGLTPRQEKREESLKRKAQDLASRLGLFVYHQGDPRGVSLYLLEDEKEKESNYYNGLAIY
jgi:hypothetical protein